MRIDQIFPSQPLAPAVARLIAAGAADESLLDELAAAPMASWDAARFARDTGAYAHALLGVADLPVSANSSFTPESFAVWRDDRSRIFAQQFGVRHWPTSLSKKQARVMKDSGRFRVLNAVARKSSERGGRASFAQVGGYGVGDFSNLHKLGYENDGRDVYPLGDPYLAGARLYSKVNHSPRFRDDTQGLGLEMTISVCQQCFADGYGRMFIDVGADDPVLLQAWADQGWEFIAADSTLVHHWNEMGWEITREIPSNKAGGKIAVAQRSTRLCAASPTRIARLDGAAARRWFALEGDAQPLHRIAWRGGFLAVPYRMAPELALSALESPWTFDDARARGSGPIFQAPEDFDPRCFARIASTALALFTDHPDMDVAATYGEFRNACGDQPAALSRTLRSPGQAKTAQALRVVDRAFGGKVSGRDDALGETFRLFPPTINGLGWNVAASRRQIAALDGSELAERHPKRWAADTINFHERGLLSRAINNRYYPWRITVDPERGSPGVIVLSHDYDGLTPAAAVVYARGRAQVHVAKDLQAARELQQSEGISIIVYDEERDALLDDIARMREAGANVARFTNFPDLIGELVRAFARSEFNIVPDLRVLADHLQLAGYGKPVSVISGAPTFRVNNLEVIDFPIFDPADLAAIIENQGTSPRLIHFRSPANEDFAIVATPEFTREPFNPDDPGRKREFFLDGMPPSEWLAGFGAYAERLFREHGPMRIILCNLDQMIRPPTRRPPPMGALVQRLVTTQLARLPGIFSEPDIAGREWVAPAEQITPEVCDRLAQVAANCRFAETRAELAAEIRSLS